MELITRTLGLLSANCYILRSDERALVIDPGGEPDIIIPFIQDRKLDFVIDTHGHYDHIAANNELKARFDTQLAVGKYDCNMLMNPELNLSATVDRPFISVPPDTLLDDGDTLNFDGRTLEVIYTPGHTSGGICLKMQNVLFSGDTLFYHSVGRTDLPTGSADQLRKSIKSRLYILPDDITVYPGHGEKTTIGEEKKNNEFVRG